MIDIYATHSNTRVSQLESQRTDPMGRSPSEKSRNGGRFSPEDVIGISAWRRSFKWHLFGSSGDGSVVPGLDGPGGEALKR